MAVRKNLPHHQIVRERIQTTQLIKRLHAHVLGEVELSATQVAAALGLIRKTLPDLAAMELSGEVEQRQYVISSTALTEEQWQQKYGQPLPALPHH